MKNKQNTKKPIPDLTDDEKYGNYIPCSLRPSTAFSPGDYHYQGTMQRSEQKKNKLLNKDSGYNSYKVLDYIESIK